MVWILVGVCSPGRDEQKFNSQALSVISLGICRVSEQMLHQGDLTELT